VLPIFRNHDKTAVEVFAYSDVPVPDATTAQFRSLADHWLDVTALSDEQLAKQIREDRIDILVELTGHIGGGRLRALAYKPAPVQVSYIGYQGTTGLAAVDYVITDDWADPPGAERNYVEKPFRLPNAFFVYDPPLDAPLVSPVPSKRMGYINFGCLNAVNKVTPKTVALWAKIMAAVPGSKLLLMTTVCWNTNDRIMTGLEAGGVTGDRVQLVYRANPIDYFRRYSHIDIALDPVPMNGHTTTCDAAWMGVPTVTLSGQIYAHRYGGSVVRNLGLPDLISESEDGYVNTAVALANDPERLSSLRATLRQTMQTSAITDGPGFTKDLEGAYRQMWAAWVSS
jgi:predicted O-linked N-acetylglucosamine transferase (SPINDLY family)